MLSVETRTELFNQYIRMAHWEAKKIKSHYVGGDFGWNPLIDEDEWDSIVSLCTWQLLEKYKTNRGANAGTFIVKYLNSRIRREINCIQPRKKKGKIVNYVGLKDDYGKSTLRKGIKHYSWHGRRTQIGDGIFYGVNKFLEQYLEIDGKFTDFETLDDIGIMAILEANRQVNGRFIIRKYSDGWRVHDRWNKNTRSTARDILDYQILEAYFGFGNYDVPVQETTHYNTKRKHSGDRTMEEVAAWCGVTRERVRQILEQCFEQIKKAITRYQQFGFFMPPRTHRAWMEVNQTLEREALEAAKDKKRKAASLKRKAVRHVKKELDLWAWM